MKRTSEVNLSKEEPEPKERRIPAPQIIKSSGRRNPKSSICSQVFLIETDGYRISNWNQANETRGKPMLCLGDVLPIEKDEWEQFDAYINNPNYMLSRNASLMEDCQYHIAETIFKFMYANYQHEISTDLTDVENVRRNTMRQLEQIPNLHVDLHPLICFYTNALLCIEKLKQKRDCEITERVKQYREEAS